MERDCPKEDLARDGVRVILFLSKNPNGKAGNIFYGLGEVVDGLIRALTFGFVATRIPLEIDKFQAMNVFKKRMSK